MRGDIVEGVFEMHTLARWRVFLDGHAGPPLGARPDRPRDKTAAAVGAHVVQVVLYTVRAERALVRADTRFRCAWRKVLVAIFAVRPELQRHGRLVMSGPDGPSQIRREMRMANLPRFRPCQCHFRDVQLHIVDAPTELGSTRVRLCHLSKSATADLDGAGPESIRPMVLMDFRLARFVRARKDNRRTNGPSAATP
jgi:hypothetical protein